MRSGRLSDNEEVLPVGWPAALDASNRYQPPALFATSTGDIQDIEERVLR